MCVIQISGYFMNIRNLESVTYFGTLDKIKLTHFTFHEYLKIREGIKEIGKILVFCKTKGGGVSEGEQKTKPQVWGLKKSQKWSKMA